MADDDIFYIRANIDEPFIGGLSDTGVSFNSHIGKKENQVEPGFVFLVDWVFRHAPDPLFISADQGNI